MSPVIQRVAQGIRHCSSPLLKFFVIGFVASAISFSHPIGAHGPPLVVIAVQPGLAEVVKNFVFGYLLWRQMVVVVDNGHFAGVLMVEQSR